jgi:hypothetical protein
VGEKVARHELPWVFDRERANSERVASGFYRLIHNPSHPACACGLGETPPRFPRVATMSSRPNGINHPDVALPASVGSTERFRHIREFLPPKAVKTNNLATPKAVKTNNLATPKAVKAISPGLSEERATPGVPSKKAKL